MTATSRITLPAPIERALFDTQAPKLIRHLTAVPAASAEGLVADVYEQMRREFQLVPPVTLHAPNAELLAAVWAMLRETVVAGPVDRTLREVACEAVSKLNRCAFCVDAHSTLLTGVRQGRAAEAIHRGRPDQLTDPTIRAVAEWALANRTPGAGILVRPPFPPADAPAIIGSAVAFHYLDRMVSVFLPDAPVPLPPWLQWLRAAVIRVAGSTVGRRIMSVTVDPGRAVGAGTAPTPAPSPAFRWASSSPAIAAAIGRLEAVTGAEGCRVLPAPVRELVAGHVDDWRGEHPSISRSWVETAIEPLDGPDRPAARLALLVALAPYQVDDAVISAFRADQPTDQALLAATSWAAFTATRRLAGWLSPTAAGD